MIRVFFIASILTLALAVRSQHALESAVIWWIHILPILAYSHSYIGARIYIYEWILLFSVFNYFIFHSFHFWFNHSTLAQGVSFWPASLISFILITTATVNELKKSWLTQ